jgi:hypothetical protein
VLGEWHRLLLRHSGLSILVSDSDGSMRLPDTYRGLLSLRIRAQRGVD